MAAKAHAQLHGIQYDFDEQINNDNWKIQVADDGIGFNTGNSFTGSGISNLQERAAACGWKISWETGQEKGTVVELGNGYV